LVRETVRILALSSALLGVGGHSVSAQTVPYITLASTTSTENSGFFSHILPVFETAKGISVRVVAVGTGQAIRLAERGDADVLLVHHKPSEENFVEKGYGIKRYDLMFNDFVVVGPEDDPARISGAAKVTGAFALISDRRAVFASRGDNSGTHKAELSLWQKIQVNVSKVSGTWYREVGAGMGATLNIAAGMNAYTLVDRATWMSFKNKGAHKILFQGDPVLFNQYGVIAVSPRRHPHIKAGLADEFIRWLISDEGQRSISNFTIAGQPVFKPNASRTPTR